MYAPICKNSGSSIIFVTGHHTPIVTGRRRWVATNVTNKKTASMVTERSTPHRGRTGLKPFEASPGGGNKSVPHRCAIPVMPLRPLGSPRAAALLGGSERRAQSPCPACRLLRPAALMRVSRRARAGGSASRRGVAIAWVEVCRPHGRAIRQPAGAERRRAGWKPAASSRGVGRLALAGGGGYRTSLREEVGFELAVSPFWESIHNELFK